MQKSASDEFKGIKETASFIISARNSSWRPPYIQSLFYA